MCVEVPGRSFTPPGAIFPNPQGHARLGSIIVTLEFLRASHFPHFPHWIFIPVFLMVFSTGIRQSSQLICALSRESNAYASQIWPLEGSILHNSFDWLLPFPRHRQIRKLSIAHVDSIVSTSFLKSLVDRLLAGGRTWTTGFFRGHLMLRSVGVDKAFPLLRISPAVPDHKDDHPDADADKDLHFNYFLDKTVGRTAVSRCGQRIRPTTASSSVFNLTREINREFAFWN